MFIPKPAEVQAWAEATGAVAQVASLLEAVAEANQFRLEHRSLRQPRTIQDRYNALHAQSARITMVDVATLPSVVQTIDYATTVLGTFYRQLGLDVDADDLTRAAAARAERGASLDDPDRSYRLVVAERALRAVTDPAMALGALDRLVAAAETADVTVVPDGAAIIAHGFGVFDDEVVIEPVAGPEIVHPAGSVLARQYVEVADRFISAGLDQADSVEAIKAAQRSLEAEKPA